MRLLGLWLFLVLGCGPSVPPVPIGLDAGPPPVCGTMATVVCVGSVAHTCDGTSELPTSSVDCERTDQICAERLGCAACAPGQVRCTPGAAGELRERCALDGAGWETLETCDAAAGLRCGVAGCLDLCAEAEATESYIGCEYTPVTLRNSQLAPAFTFAVAIANPQLVPASVTIDGGALSGTDTLTIAAGGLEVVELPWVDELRGDASPPLTRRIAGGAYRIRSDVPVTVTQFNPLRFEETVGCSGRDCYSFTNDASLLLPTHVLTGSYLSVTRPTQLLGIDASRFVSPGFVALVGAADGPVDVEVRVSAPTLGGDVPPMTPGTPATLTLMPGEVIQLLGAPPETCPGDTHTETAPDGSLVTYCDAGAGFDLTGTEIRSSGPLAVFVGHDCTFVPYDRWACDHLEEQLFPVEALGNEVLLPVTEALRPREPNVVRVVSAMDGNEVRFEPPLVVGEAPRALDRGEYVEVELTEARWVRGTGPLLSALFLVGQNYAGIGSTSLGAVGDPAMALAVPSAQFRGRYDFLTPDSYTRSAATVVAPMGARVVIDGRFVTLDEITGTTMGIAHVDLDPGVHASTANVQFGLYLTGYASYTSYFVPGGMDFVPITPPF